MDHETRPIARLIGSRVRRQRQSYGWSLDYLAAKSNVSRRVIVNVEQGANNPGFETLLRLSNALGTDLSLLVEPDQSGPVRVRRGGSGAVLWKGEFGGHGILVATRQVASRDEPTAQPDGVELWSWRLARGDVHSAEIHSRGSCVLLQVIDGSIIVNVGDQRYDLTAGDALSLPGDVSQSYSNTTCDWAHYTMALFDPTPGRPLGRISARSC